MQVSFHFLEKVNLPERKKLKKFVISVFCAENEAAKSLSVIFCSDDYLLRINQDFLRHDYLTDIITFNLAPHQAPVEGELYISVDRVAENAENFKTSKVYELHRVVFHGLLHLCGYKDKTASQAKEIRRKENFYLEKYFNK